jgi:hypothetical protein
MKTVSRWLLTLLILGRPYLQHLKLFQPLLNQLLDLARILHRLVLMECISRSALGVLSEVVGCELAALAEDLAVLEDVSVKLENRARSILWLQLWG